MGKAPSPTGCKPLSGLLAALLVLSFGGCGPDRPDTVSVSGRVTYGGGSWPKPGRLYFTPIEPAEGFPGRPGQAQFGTDGRFEAGTWENRDGLMPGRYKVSVECWEAPPSMDNSNLKSYTPAPYQSAATSNWQIDVKPDAERLKIEFDVPKRSA